MSVKYTLEQAYARTIKDVVTWCRFDQIDNLLPKPTGEEVRIAINLAVDDINTTPPRTSATLLSSVNSADAYYTTIMYGACKNVLWTLLVDWTANGVDAQLDSLSLSSRRPDYEALFNLANDEFNRRLERIKASYGLKSIGKYNSVSRSVNGRRSVLKPPFHSSGYSAGLSDAQINRP